MVSSMNDRSLTPVDRFHAGATNVRLTPGDAQAVIGPAGPMKRNLDVTAATALRVRTWTAGLRSGHAARPQQVSRPAIRCTPVAARPVRRSASFPAIVVRVMGDAR